MARHSKNNTANPIFTYHERKKVKDVGTIRERLGKDSMRKFEQCWICLRTAENPVSSPYGYIFCKICIINNFLNQKKIYAKKKKEYEDYIKDMKRKKKEELLQEKEKEKKKFLQDLENLNTPNVQKEEEKNLLDISNNFWLSCNSSKVKKDAIQKKLKPPSKELICPITKKPLKMNELITINPEVIKNEDSENGKWVCSFSKKNIDHHKAVLLKKTGKIILKSFFENFIYGKKNSYDITVGEDDFINLEAGGTAFCSHSNVEKTLYRESLL
ncbi:conserved protein, unknown function [Plasmodium sp. gorilla clade G2]|uniref:conserved protein, unknown function n=1 Tax=Plasmodium sp. gorilla clade G2 TaxID=880535 RepID=UPI000D20A2D7|nr:conserved protein, unknown function [Plasmodium sp. gorilla clade G2]SOV11747.1 conserved protein, unknown function [Plasmodium sp. gorilla clade G2]